MADSRIVSGGQNETPIRAADVVRLLRRDVLAVVLANPSGDLVNPGGDGGTSQASAATYGRKNVSTAATLIVSANSGRKNAFVQNLERQQIVLGFDSSLTVLNGGVALHPTSANSSGDGGRFSTDYTGDIYGIVASGDLDVRYSETT